MQRSAIVPSIYGYLVCLLAIVLFIHSAAGIVDGLFGVASPAAFGQHHRGSMMATPPRPMYQGGIDRGGPDMAAPAPWGQMRAAADAGGRLQALRVLVVNLVLLAIAVLLFRRHWQWLHGEAAAALDRPTVT